MNIVETWWHGGLVGRGLVVFLTMLNRGRVRTVVICTAMYLLKAKFRYASWLEAGSKLARSWSPTSFEPVCAQLRTSFEPDSVMEFGVYWNTQRQLITRPLVSDTQHWKRLA